MHEPEEYIVTSYHHRSSSFVVRAKNEWRMAILRAKNNISIWRKKGRAKEKPNPQPVLYNPNVVAVTIRVRVKMLEHCHCRGHGVLVDIVP